MIGNSLRAELFALRQRRSVWVLAGVWGLQILLFAYLIAYVIYRSMGDDLGAGEAVALRDSLLPGSVDPYVVGSMPIWGGPVMLIIGALVSASDYRWGTLRTIMARFANRGALLVGRYLALVLVMLGVAVATMLLGAVASLGVALADGSAIGWPGPGELIAAVGALWLVATAWASLGFAVGVLTRNVAATIGIGLVWTLLVENVVGVLAGSLGLDGVTAVLLGPASAAMSEALGASPGAGGGFAITAVTGPAVAVTVLAGYAVVSLLAALAVFRRRDLV